MNPAKGKVYLVGAGPGDPGLVTVRGAECLRRAGLVLYDYLVDPRVLRHSPAAERICLGSHATGRIMSQDEVNRRMVDAARQGKTVVRLKGGDPTLFARAAEELAALREADVDFEIVPGVSAAVAVGSYAGIPLTHREMASCVAFVTGQETPYKAAAPLDYGALAGFPGTLVFYMGITTAREWSGALLAGGLPGETSVAVVRHCSSPEQQIWRCRLENVAETIEEEHIRPPALVVVGQVAATQEYAWFAERPLFGQSVLVTRPEHQSAELEQKFAELGARVLLQPAIEILPPRIWTAVDAALGRIRDFDWVVFSSANGVTALLDRIMHTGRDLRALGNARLAAIGPATADALRARGLVPDVTPKQFRAEGLAAALSADARGKRFLLIRASRGREVLAETLSAAGAHVEQVVVYESKDVPQADAEILAEMQGGRIDWVTVTSSAIARSLVHLFGNSLRRTKLVAISPVTAETLAELGHSPAAVARTYTSDGVIESILNQEDL